MFEEIIKNTLMQRQNIKVFICDRYQNERTPTHCFHPSIIETGDHRNSFNWSKKDVKKI